MPAEDTPVPSGGSGGAVALAIDVDGDLLAFTTDSLSAEAGSDVVVTFNNSSGVNSHNWALVEAGTKDDVATAGLAAGQDNNWLPSGDSRLLGATVLLGPGESGQAEFTAPAAGDYQFVCTFPGHNFTMFGTFTVN
jgi:azurin